LLERNAESVDGLVRALQRVETSRQATVASYGTLLERLTALSETVRTQQALLARFTELSIDLRGSVNRLSDRAAASDEQIPRTLEALQTKIDQLATDTARDRKEAADEMRAALAKLAERLPEGDRESIVTHQRNIESHLGRLVEESGRDRAALADELRGEIRLLARTLSISRPPTAPFAAAESPPEA
jgi:chromosome segregation ATPase